MADVYKGFHPALRRYVAIKLLGQSPEAEPSFAERFQREAQAIASLRHPNIIQVFDFGTQPLGPGGGQAHYLVMEYIQGKDLRADIEHRASGGEPFTRDQVLHLLGQIADALDYAHRQGIVHRDIKPGNILIAEDGRAILTDFGLVMLRDRASQATLGRSFGTPEYIAPEQAIESRAASPQSDVYSLGVVLYEMVTGRLPFEDESPLSLALKHINHDPIPPRHYVPDLPEAVERVILRALSKEPADRFSSARLMVDALTQAWSEPASLSHPGASRLAEPEGRHPAPRSLPAPKGELLASLTGRRRGPLAIGLLVLILVGLFGLFTLLQGGGRLAIAGVTPTALSTPAGVLAPSATPTATTSVTPTYTPTQTGTPSPTSTSSPSPTATQTDVPTSTSTSMPLPAPTDTPAPSPAPPPPTATPMGLEDLSNRILFKTDRAGLVEIYSMNPDGSDQRPVPDPVIYNEKAALEAFSPDRKQQIIVRTEGNAELWLVAVDQSENEWRVTYTEAYDYDPVWSPAGDLIAFVSEQTGNGDIYLSTPLGFDQKRITFNEDAQDKHPSWSPDGRYLAFWSNYRFNLRQIYRYDIWTGETRMVGGGPFNDWDPLWVK